MKTQQIERDRDRREAERTDPPKFLPAVLLGQRNKGRKKTITPELAKAMRDRLAFHRVKRWMNRKPKEAQ
jgi:hypothetical protein